MILAPRQRYGVVFATRVGESRWLCPASAWGAGGGRMGPKGWLLAGRLAASRRSKAQDTFWARASDCGRRRALCSVYHPPSEAEYYDLVQIPQGNLHQGTSPLCNKSRRIGGGPGDQLFDSGGLVVLMLEHGLQGAPDSTLSTNGENTKVYEPEERARLAD